MFKSFSNTKMAGDLTLGYATPSFGIVAVGTGLYYAVDKPDLLIDTTRGEVDAEAWYVTGKEQTTGRFEARLRFAGLNNSSTVTTVQSGKTSFHDEDTWMWRPSALLGFRLHPGPNFHFYVLAGGGVQYEMYDYLDVTGGYNGGEDIRTLSGQGYGRTQLRWGFLPGWLSFRARADGYVYSMTSGREDLMTKTIIKTSGSAMEFRSRASIELNALEFLGISPFIYGGLDYFKHSIRGETITHTAPGFGVGLFKPVD